MQYSIIINRLIDNLYIAVVVIGIFLFYAQNPSICQDMDFDIEQDILRIYREIKIEETAAEYIISIEPEEFSADSVTAIGVFYQGRALNGDRYRYNITRSSIEIIIYNVTRDEIYALQLNSTGCGNNICSRDECLNKSNICEKDCRLLECADNKICTSSITACLNDSFCSYWLGENCQNSAGCQCNSTSECDPDSPEADDFGCVEKLELTPSPTFMLSPEPTTEPANHTEKNLTVDVTEKPIPPQPRVSEITLELIEGSDPPAFLCKFRIESDAKNNYKINVFFYLNNETVIDTKLIRCRTGSECWYSTEIIEIEDNTRISCAIEFENKKILDGRFYSDTIVYNVSRMTITPSPSATPESTVVVTVSPTITPTEMHQTLPSPSISSEQYISQVVEQKNVGKNSSKITVAVEQDENRKNLRKSMIYTAIVIVSSAGLAVLYSTGLIGAGTVGVGATVGVVSGSKITGLANYMTRKLLDELIEDIIAEKTFMYLKGKCLLGDYLISSKMLDRQGKSQESQYYFTGYLILYTLYKKISATAPEISWILYGNYGYSDMIEDYIRKNFLPRGAIQYKKTIIPKKYPRYFMTAVERSRTYRWLKFTNIENKIEKLLDLTDFL